MPDMPGMPPQGGGSQAQVNEPSTRDRINRAKVIARRAAQHWVIATLLLVVGCGISIAVAMNSKSTYRSEIVIAFRAGFKAGKQDEGPAERAARLKPKLEAQVKSRARLERMIKEFNLYQDTVKSQGIITAIDEMGEKYVGFRGKDAERFVVSFENTDPELARKVTQRLGESVVEEFGKEALNGVRQQVEFLTDQETKLLTDLDNANRELTTFLAAHPEFAAEMKKGGGAMQPGGGIAAPPANVNGAPIVLQTSSDPATQALLRQRQRIESQLKAIQSGGAAPAAVPPELESRRARAANERDAAQNTMNEANSELGRVRSSGISDEHPDMRAVKGKVTAAKNQLAAADAKVRDIDQEIRLAQQTSTVAPTAENIDKLKKELAAVDAQIASLRGGKPAGDAGKGVVEEPTGIVGLETTFQKLLRRSQEARTQLNELKEQVNKARLELSAEQAKSSDSLDIAEIAFLPTKPAKGGKSKVAMTGGGVALAVAILYALARVAFSDRIIDSGDVEALQIIPVLGVLPKIAGAGLANGAATAAGPGGPQQGPGPGPGHGPGGPNQGPGGQHGMPPPIVPGRGNPNMKMQGGRS